MTAAIRSLDPGLVQLPTIGGGVPFGTFTDTLDNQHAANENIRVGHLYGNDRHLRRAADDASPLNVLRPKMAKTRPDFRYTAKV